MAIESLVFCVDKYLPERRVHLFITDWCAVYAEELADLFSIGTIYLRCLICYWVLNAAKAWRFAEQP